MNPPATPAGPTWRAQSARRAAVLWIIVAGAFGLLARSTLAQDAVVPAQLQGELLAKVAAYDRNLDARAGDTVRIILVVKPGDAKSSLSAATMRSVLSHIDRVGGLPHQESIVPYEGAAALVARCRSEHVSIVYFTPGFTDDIDQLRASFAGVDILSVSAVPEYVARGIVLGFDLVSGKPKLLLNLPQAKEQNVNFKADVIALMKVYR
jgi:hypothetical protein